MSKHTPGPWEVGFKERFPFGVSVIAPGGVVIHSEYAIAHATGQKTRRDCEGGFGFSGADREQAIKMVAEQDANARLIAAAPDLLEACKSMVLLANRAWHHLDADEDHKVGKILMAMAGHLKGYLPETTRLHETIAKAEGKAVSA